MTLLLVIITLSPHKPPPKHICHRRSERWRLHCENIAKMAAREQCISPRGKLKLYHSHQRLRRYAERRHDQQRQSNPREVNINIYVGYNFVLRTISSCMRAALILNSGPNSKAHLVYISAASPSNTSNSWPHIQLASERDWMQSQYRDRQRKNVVWTLTGLGRRWTSWPWRRRMYRPAKKQIKSVDSNNAK